MFWAWPGMAACRMCRSLLVDWRGLELKVTRVSGDGNFVHGVAFVDPAKLEVGPFHVSRCRRIDMTRATVAEVVAHQLDAGSAVVDAVEGHRALENGSYEFKIKWFPSTLVTWVPAGNVSRVIKVIDYCKVQGLPDPGSAPKVVVVARAAGRGRGGRGRGRGRH